MQNEMIGSEKYPKYAHKMLKPTKISLSDWTADVEQLSLNRWVEQLRLNGFDKTAKLEQLDWTAEIDQVRLNGLDWTAGLDSRLGQFVS